MNVHVSNPHCKCGDCQEAVEAGLYCKHCATRDKGKKK